MSLMPVAHPGGMSGLSCGGGLDSPSGMRCSEPACIFPAHRAWRCLLHLRELADPIPFTRFAGRVMAGERSALISEPFEDRPEMARWLELWAPSGKRKQ